MTSVCLPTWATTPYTVKEDVKAMLIELELPELAKEKEQA